MLIIVTGVPGSGKSTYVQQHKGTDDIIIDMDLIAVAIGSPVSHCHSTEITQVAQYMRGAGIKAAIAWAIRGHTVWIIDCRPNAQRLKQYAIARPRFVRMNGANVIVAKVH